MTYVTTILSPEQTLDAALHDLPADDTRAAQHQFTAERQAAFLSRLAASGSARSAVRAAQVSHQTAYRQRRACRQFRRAWDAALLVARTHAEEVLAVRAIEGVEEEVWYHGEVVATRRRYDSRLLLAHLARLDRLVEDADTAALAEEFDAVLERLERGEDLPPPPVPAETPGISSGQCNTRSKSPAAEEVEEEEVPELERRIDAMEAALPRDAEPLPPGVEAADRVEAVRLHAFEAGVAEWWTLTEWDDLEAALDLLAETAEAVELSSAPVPASLRRTRH
jgi:hypothetical protein